MEIREQRQGGVVILAPTGDMDSRRMDAFEERVTRLLAEGARAVLWDLEAVGVLTSVAVGFFIQTGRRLQEAGVQMALCRAGRLARNTLDTLGVTEVFRLYDTPEEALAALDDAAA